MVTPEKKFNDLLHEYDAEFLQDFGHLSNLTRSIIDFKTEDEHLKLIQQRTYIIWETFTGVLSLVALELIVSAFAHCRTLYENVLSTLHLLHDKNRKKDYLDHAKVLSFELNENLGRDAKELDVVRPEYQALKPTFVKGKKPLFWHKMSIWKLAEVVDAERNAALTEQVSPLGFFPHMQKTFYSEVSSIAHGEWFLGIRYGENGWYYDVEHYDLSGIDRIALNISYSIVTIFFESVIPHFNLPFEKELAAVNGISKKHLTVENNDNASGQAVESGGATT
jgi:hypothetical protein